ncbi:N-acetylmuramoyl-L-alanine amidase [Clostridioides difficile]|uniref:N-acetylmuramoyl-L-alanine amidase n=9 Tax=root TaxID=1 RepID=A0A3G1E396_9CAUD|nr:N-acetylmuramoyl-L-alanine amidase [Clostridioides difficile]YP_009830828.1 N-acetylmuramoyl-L-alanine amidase [Clostridium phage CDKM9]ANT45100.1 N-acetylmuramoyl-L-alanine amidase [Clostridium phage CDKM9]MBH7951524.1 N-acetylmuramoyl-L-alanine amidase [Clostridioides difficile]MCL6857076.1 N-acetylmuramoyl-L-alanine amidase [Clostridioides difficile]MDN4787782.1 N-acetylmuramoyl-L-alanine amidase [Clostridioides difficile]MDN9919659.1 N-acetylmuramoyl-L-alanine amidase [Clostridioides d
MKICITVGHSILKSGACTSANGVVNEYQYNKSLAPVLADTFRKEGHKADVIICPEKQFKTKSEEKSYKIPKVNSGGYDLLIELHLNSSGVGAFGTEVFYYSEKGKEYAQRVVDKLSKPFIRKKGDKEVGNRGVKLDKSLYILNSSKPTAILIESFFCDNKEDYEKAKKLGHEGIAKLIVEGVLNKNINNEGVKQMYKHTIIYDGEVDKIPATVVGWGYNDGKILICDIKDYVPGQTQNLYVVGGGACEKISSITKEKFIMIKGNDRFDTLYKALDFINR